MKDAFRYSTNEVDAKRNVWVTDAFYSYEVSLMMSFLSLLWGKLSVYDVEGGHSCFCQAYNYASLTFLRMPDTGLISMFSRRNLQIWLCKFLCLLFHKKDT